MRDRNCGLPEPHEKLELRKRSQLPAAKDVREGRVILLLSSHLLIHCLSQPEGRWQGSPGDAVSRRPQILRAQRRAEKGDKYIWGGREPEDNKSHTLTPNRTSSERLRT